MSRFAIAVTVSLLLATGCAKTEYRVGEGTYCSTVSEDPSYVCSPSQDLICIATSTIEGITVTDAGPTDAGTHPLFLCRLACDPSEVCPQAGDVCCTGTIFGRTYGGKTRACVPPGQCETEPDIVVPKDAGADRSPLDVGASDGQTPDAGTDGPSVDAPQ